MALRPSWKRYHRIGEEVARELDANYTYQQIGDSLGISKQKAYHETMVALGKLAYQFRANLGDGTLI
jgi:hypothetical protein